MRNASNVTDVILVHAPAVALAFLPFPFVCLFIRVQVSQLVVGISAEIKAKLLVVCSTAFHTILWLFRPLRAHLYCYIILVQPVYPRHFNDSRLNAFVHPS
jgi:hypothetical protein